MPTLYVHIYIHIHINTLTQAHTQYTHKHTHTYIHTYIRIYIRGVMKFWNLKPNENECIACLNLEKKHEISLDTIW